MTNTTPIHWQVAASMEQVQKDHPEWTEEQCREEFNRQGDAALQKIMDDMDSSKRKRKPKA